MTIEANKAIFLGGHFFFSIFRSMPMASSEIQLSFQAVAYSRDEFIAVNMPN
jgi:hypothetical protein